MAINLKTFGSDIVMLKTSTLKPSVGRTAFTTDRALEFFTEAELTTQIGYGRELWPLVLAKELIDNALDACESRGAQPCITITLKPNTLTIADNGPGIPENVIRKSLDYLIRISDKKGYVSPTRGQLGNALKAVWAAPFVVNGAGLVAEVTACGQRHRITVGLDRIAQKPIIEQSIKPSTVQYGTSITVHWSGIASIRFAAESRNCTVGRCVRCWANWSAAFAH